MAAARQGRAMIADPLFSILIRAFAVGGWLIVCGRILHAVSTHQERRLTFVMMGVISLMAAIGSLASGIGGAQRVDAIHWAIPADLLAMVANAGAGALAAGALIVATHYRPPVTRP